MSTSLPAPVQPVGARTSDEPVDAVPAYEPVVAASATDHIGVSPPQQA